MTLRAGADLGEVAIRVGDALRRADIKAVLTGGACAHIHSGGAYTSRDVDFVLIELPTRAELDQALARIGFERHGDHYEHPKLAWIVEFPRGPLAIGTDHSIRPMLLKKARWSTRALSPTDSCRDRLAAFYHWNDRQALAAAVAIATRHRINMPTVRRWSEAEGARDRCAEFERARDAARRSARER